MRTRLLFFACAAMLLAVPLVSCDKDDEEKRITNFDVPELTDANTIQFTVNVTAGAYAFVSLDGGKLAVDWGDGAMTKDMNPSQGNAVWRMEFTHVYKQSGEYTVKIWSDEVTFINASGLSREYSQLKVGNCPILKDANFNTFVETAELDLNGCAALESLNLGNWAQLESVALDKCTELGSVDIYTNPELKAMDLSKNSKLRYLTCSDCGIESLSLPKGVNSIVCRRTGIASLTLDGYSGLTNLILTGNRKLASLDLTGCDELRVIDFSDTQIDAFDFSEFPALEVVYCNDSKMTAVDVTEVEGLVVLDCSGLGLASLDITQNAGLQALFCSDNELTSLDVSHNPRFKHLYIDGNELDKANLESIFSALPVFDQTRASMPRPTPSEIKIFGNPGAETCDKSIITDKGWVVKVD